MLLKNLEKLIRRTGSAELICGGECLWIDNGYVIAPLSDFDHLTDEQFYVVFNIPEDKRNGFVLTRRGINLEEEDLFRDLYADEDALAVDLSRILRFGGSDAAPMLSSRGILYADLRDLAPFLKEDDQVQFYARWRDGEPLPKIAAKRGMMLAGMLDPMLTPVKLPVIAKWLEELAKATRRALEQGYTVPEGGDG